MWLRHWEVNVNALGQLVPDPQAMLPSGLHINIKVRRKLTPGQQVVLFYQSFVTLALPAALQISPRLRTLVGRAI